MGQSYFLVILELMFFIVVVKLDLNVKSKNARKGKMLKLQKTNNLT